MTIPEASDDFIVEATRQAVSKVASTQHALRHCLDRSAAAGDACVAVWRTLQRAGFLATLQLQDAVVEASRTVLDATFQGSPPPVRQGRSEARHLWPESTLKLTARGTRIVEGRPMPLNPEDPEAESQEDWTRSALQFQPPFGMDSLSERSDPDGKD